MNEWRQPRTEVRRRPGRGLVRAESMKGPALLRLLACLACSAQSSTQGEDHSSTSEQAALTTLFVLGATTAGPGLPSAYVLLPSRDQISLEQAASVLAIRTKPVQCKGNREASVLVVQCVALTNAEELESHKTSARLTASMFARGVEKRCTGPLGDAEIVLYRQADSMRISFDAFAAWLTQYKLQGFSLGTKPRAKPPACMVIVIGPPATMKIPERKPAPSRT